MRAREYHATKVILIGCLREMSIHQKVGGRHLEEGFKQALFSISRFCRESGLPSETKIEPDRRLNILNEKTLQFSC